MLYVMGNQQRSPEQGNVQRLSFAGVGRSRPKRPAPQNAGEDIVCTHVKAWGVRLSLWKTADKFVVFTYRRNRIESAPQCEQKWMKQLMAGGGVALIWITLVPLLSGLFG